MSLASTPITLLPRECFPIGLKLDHHVRLQCMLARSQTATFSPLRSLVPDLLSVSSKGVRVSQRCAAAISDSETSPESVAKPKKRGRPKKSKESDTEVDNSLLKPRKPRRGRRSQDDEVEDYIHEKFKNTLDADAFEKKKEEILKHLNDKARSDDAVGTSESDDEDKESDEEAEEEQNSILEDDDSHDSPADTKVAWGISASEYFEKHPIKNVVGDDGSEIDWEGELDNSWIQEINCLEWESYAFHPSPLIVFVFERYNRAMLNWKVLKEMEKALKVYWNAKDRLPPRAVKLDIKIERDLAYALQVKEGPQILFLRGNKILYREKDLRTSEELVQMIAYFYYKARKPSCIDDSALPF